tara:strand:+ start:388 stop:1248 length:861 start_codon:yes stop_codon:yes gene_type:complete
MRKKKRKSYTRQNVNKSKPKAKTTPKLKPKAKAAPSPYDLKRGARIPKPRRAATKLGRLKTKIGGKLRTAQRKGAERAAKALDKARKTKAIKDFNKAKPTPKGHAPKLTKTQLKGLKGTRALQKGLGISKHASKLKNIKGAVKGGVIYGAADWGSRQLLDRAERQLLGQSKRSLKDYRKLRNQYKKDKEVFNWMGGRKKDSPNLKQWIKQKESGSSGNNTGSSSKPKNKEVTNTKKSSALKISAKDKAEYLKKTRNSPAAKAGFSDDHRWELQKKHREWKKKHNRR